MNKELSSVHGRDQTLATAELNNRVGPVIKMGPLADAAIAAIEEDNPEREIHVIDRHAFLRVEAEDELIVRRATLERLLGRPFQMQEFGTVLASFAGRVESTPEYFRFYFETHL